MGYPSSSIPAGIVRGQAPVNTKASITLPYPPSANRYWRHVGARVLISREAREFRARAYGIACAAGLRPIAGDVALTIDVFRPAKRGDLDNCLKVAIDSIRGVAFNDDKQITKITARRHDDKANPRIEIAISVAGDGDED